MLFRKVLHQILGQKELNKIKALTLIIKNHEPSIEFISSLKFGCKLPWKILVGAHHKTGTAYVNSIFRTICRWHSLIYYQGEQENLPSQFDIFSNVHSEFSLDLLNFEFRGVHIIRDPRDVIISGCFYHQHTREKSLHYPRKEFNGLSYQQQINSYNHIDDQILFEMSHYARDTIHDMIKWNYTNDYFFEIKYEDLIEDSDLKTFHKMFSFLGFPGEIIPGLLEIAYNNSLFSGKVYNPDHIRSGKKEQWKQYFKPIHKDMFLQLFNDALIQLGYESDNNW